MAKMFEDYDADDTAPWMSLRERGSVQGLKFMSLVFRLLGERVCLLILYPVTLYFVLTGRMARRASRSYLTRVWNILGASSGMARKPGLVEVFKHFYEFGLSIVDRFQLWLGRGELFTLSWDGDGRQLFLDAIAGGRGGILMSAHLGNMEVLRALAREKSGVIVHALMYTKHARRVNNLFNEINPDSGLQLVPLERISVDSIFYLEERLNRGEFVAMLADRISAGAPGRACTVPFLGSEASFPQGPFILAGLLKAPVYLIFALRTGRREFKIYFELFAACMDLPKRNKSRALDEYGERFAKRLEQHCFIAPFQWFNFYDFWIKESPEHGETRTVPIHDSKVSHNA